MGLGGCQSLGWSSLRPLLVTRGTCCHGASFAWAAPIIPSVTITSQTLGFGGGCRGAPSVLGEQGSPDPSPSRQLSQAARQGDLAGTSGVQHVGSVARTGGEEARMLLLAGPCGAGFGGGRARGGHDSCCRARWAAPGRFQSLRGPGGGRRLGQVSLTPRPGDVTGRLIRDLLKN